MANKEKKQGTFSKLIEVYKFTKELRPKLPIYIFSPLVLLIVASIIITVLTKFWMTIPVFIMLGILIGVIILSRTADKAGIESVEGKQGASGAVVNGIKTSGWEFKQEPVYADQKSGGLIFWGIGRPGVALICEGPSSQMKKGMDSWNQKIKRIVPNLTIHSIYTGNQKGQVPLGNLRKKVTRLKPTLSKNELEEVKKRLSSLLRFAMPIPKGIDPNRMRPNRKLMK